MTPARVSAKVVTERAGWVRAMLAGLRNLPLESLEEFRRDPRNAAAAESYLRRALEALLDLGRHVLAKSFGRAVAEYKEVANALVEEGILSGTEGDLLRQLAGYRNRMVHFYHEISFPELYSICSAQLSDVETVLRSLTDWVEKHPERVDGAL